MGSMGRRWPGFDKGGADRGSNGAPLTGAVRVGWQGRGAAEARQRRSCAQGVTIGTGDSVAPPLAEVLALKIRK